ncbi:hypothetical protein TKK_0001346 [Trichogramma kaykai]|uniref:LRRCT domain-containing protein n=2 Tax=Trichogramma TaxID=7490 RepID=A0ABD2WRF3_9HYME
MNLPRMGLAMLLVLLGLSYSSVHSAAVVGSGSMILMEPELPIKKCRYSRPYNRLQAACKDLKLNEIPQNLQSSIEILNVGENRIRELNNDTLARYTSLRYLYLADNFVQQVADQAFAPTYYLEALDLSKNGLLELPRSLFQLPFLRNLYLNDNQLTDATFNVTGVRSALSWLFLSGNKLTRLPRLHPLPTLATLNVSHNFISRVTVDEIAPMCSLTSLVLTGNPLKFDENTCDCYVFKKWILQMTNIKVEFKVDDGSGRMRDDFQCPKSQEERCQNVQFAERWLEKHEECESRKRERMDMQKARATWIWIGSFVGIFMACIAVALCCMHKRQRGKRQRLKEQQLNNPANSANTETLLKEEKQQHEDKLNHDLP